MTKAQRAERNRVIVQDLQGGMSRKGAATKYGLSVERIRQIARQNGVPPTRRGRPKGARVER
ncbi:MAG: hypothetical protein F4199_05750, partial [Rhodothermaceae bacterium]|nr:hypothetical protein [Rhodothermaceae bacterium]